MKIVTHFYMRKLLWNKKLFIISDSKIILIKINKS